jgi:hypothetical protein
MTGHTALEKLDKNPRLVDEFVEVVKEHVTKATAEHDAKQCAEGDEIRHLLLAQFTTPLANQPSHEEIGREKPKDVGESIPTDSEGFRKLDQKRTPVVDPVSGKSERMIGHERYLTRAVDGFKHKERHSPTVLLTFLIYFIKFMVILYFSTLLGHSMNFSRDPDPNFPPHPSAANPSLIRELVESCLAVHQQLGQHCPVSIYLDSLVQEEAVLDSDPWREVCASATQAPFN